MKQGIRILTAAVLCTLLTGCGKEEPQQPESLPNYDINVADLLNGTTAPPQIIATGTLAAESSSETVTEAAAESDGAATESKADPQSESSADAPEPAQNGGYAVAQMFDDNHFAALSCTGTVIAPDGLNLREAPGVSGKKITTLDDGTALEVLGLAVSGNLYDLSERWLKVRADGREGYALAEYIAAECTTPLSSLSEPERAALGTVLYYQALHLYPDYHRKGGPRGTYTDQFKDGFCLVSSDIKTLADLKKEFHRFFSVNCSDYLDECYLEDGGNLYVMVGYGDNVSTDYVLPDSMEQTDDNTLSFSITVHHFPEFADTNFPEWDSDLFRIVYEDGAWKTAVIKEEY